MDNQITATVPKTPIQVQILGGVSPLLNDVHERLLELEEDIDIDIRAPEDDVENPHPHTDCIILDTSQPRSNEVFEQARLVDSSPPLVLIGDDDTGTQLQEMADSGITASFTPDEVERCPSAVALQIVRQATAHQIERDIQETKQLYDTILKHSRDFVVVINRRGELTFVTPAIERVLGYTPSELLGWDVKDLIHPDDRDTAIQAVREAITEPSLDITVEFRIKHRDGDWRWLEVRGKHHPDIDGVLFNARDVSQRWEYRADLEAQLAGLEASTDGVAILDEKGHFQYANEAHARLHGLDAPEELLGESWRELYDEAMRQRIDQEISPALSREGQWHGTLTGMREDGCTFEQEIAITELDDGRMSYVVRDVTQQTEYEEALEGLHDASTELMASTTEIEVYQRMVAAAESILDFHVCCVLANEDGMLVPKAISSGAPPDGVRAMANDAGDAGQVFQTGEPKLNNNVLEDTESRPARDDYRAGVTVPIGEYGVFQAISTETDHFTQQDLDLTGILASYAKAVLDRIDSERDRQREHDRLRRLFENTTECIVEVTFDDENEPIIHAINSAFEEVFEVENDEVAGEPLDDIIVPEDDRDTAQEINHKIVQGEVVHRELVRSTPKGRLSFLLRTAPFTIDGEPRAFAIYLDISERKRQEERYQTLIEHSTDLVTLLDANGDFLYQSPSVERHLGYETDEMIGQNAFDYVHPEDRDRVMRVFYEGVDDPSSLPTVEYRFKHKDGSWRWLESLGNNQLSNQAIEAFVVNSRDITERKRREQELQRQNERLDKVSSVISHDLRNPLTVADGYLEIARQDCESEALETIDESLDRMETIINDTLTLARHGQTIGEFEEVDLQQICRLCWGTVSTGGGHLDVVESITIRCDTDRIRQVLENLFRNAVKYGGEQVHVEVGGMGDDGIYIADDGPGIAPGERDAVFEPGYTTSSESTGFGLAIVKEIVEAHGWDISITESDTGGARFEIVGVEIIDE